MELETRDLETVMERRTYTAELRIEPPSIGKRTPTIRGYAAKFNTLSEVMPMKDTDGKTVYFREQLMPGCFSAAIAVSDCRSLFNHDPNLIMGRTLAGTLRIKEDDVGLAFENDPPDTSYSRDLQVSMQRGDISQCSFGFTVSDKGDSWERDSANPGQFIRSINSIARLYDASPVTYPAYVDTSCALRSMHSQIDVEDAAASKAAADKAEEQRKMEMESLELELQLAEMDTEGTPEKRVDMGYASYNTIGTCEECNEEGCLCSTCENVKNCTLMTKSEGGTCTKCMKPKCQCLTCPNTDKATLMKMNYLY